MTRALAALVTFGATGCSLFFPAPTPMGTIRSTHGATSPNGRTLIVLLPGRGSSAKDYVEERFFQIARESRLPLDLVAVEAGLGYYMRRTLVRRLYADVIAPARRRGYKKIWIVGISMGGIGALIYAQQKGATITGVVALAPFLGDRDVIRSVAAQGVARWSPNKRVKADDYQRRLWLWLQGYARPGPPRPLLVLGWGKDDRFRRACTLLATVLPPAQVFQVSGGHDWPPWRALWRRVLASPAFRSRQMTR